MGWASKPGFGPPSPLRPMPSFGLVNLSPNTALRPWPLGLGPDGHARMNTTETRSTRIAVFIDFDNVEIGVKSTIGSQLDIGLILEAIKERGEIVTKIAYSDWKRAGDYSRLLTQHAIRMVQRNMTPGGDKNGADITMALDALEMCFTHDHINAFVIVGGDSDFISLVEKLKQYGRKVIVVGGRQFTSATMQRNCHEFIAYENLVGSRGGRPAERGSKPPAPTSDVAKALPLLKRALKVLSDREVTPQLGLLKSTLLQLDSTFSERDYGAGSFRDFMEKVAASGAVTLKHAGRSMLVEPTDDALDEAETVSPPPPSAPPPAAAPPPREVTAADADLDEEQLPQSPMSMQDGIRALQHAFTSASTPPRWPMYVRQAKQFLRNAIEGFDERKYGFASVVDLLRAAGKEGVLRVERDRQGAVRVFPGANLTPRGAAPVEEHIIDDEQTDVDMTAETADSGLPLAAEPVSDSPIVDAEPVEEAVPAEAEGPGRRGGRKRKAPAARTTRAPKAAKAARPRARKTARPKSDAQKA
jgi:uncharacterized protein (TIGR00288 family)